VSRGERVGIEERYARVCLPMLGVTPRQPGVGTSVRAAPTMLGDDADEVFAAAAVLYVDGRLAWEGEARGLTYARPGELRIPPAGAPSPPGALFVYTTREAHLAGAAPRRKRYEETWAFIVSEDGGEWAVSIPTVPYIGSGKKILDNHYHCFPGVRLGPEWRTTAYVINPYPDPLEARAWLQSTRGRTVEVLAPCEVGGRSVRVLELARSPHAGALDLDFATLVVWGNLKPQGYVAIADARGRVRAMDHFHPFWSL